MSGKFEADVLRRGTWPDGKPLTSDDREQLIKTYLPEPRNRTLSTPLVTTIPVDRRKDLLPESLNADKRQTLISLFYRPTELLRLIFYKFFFFLIQLTFSIYIHGRQTYHAIADRIFAVLYYHHKTPELIQRDTKPLGKLPRHLSLIVELRREGTGNDTEVEELLKLCSEVAEISAWCACAGIFMLSIYEQNGVLKSHMPFLHQAIENTFGSYFPPDCIPAVQLRAPNRSAFSPPTTPSTTMDDTPSLKVLLLSASDGRDTLVDLTKTLAEMSQKGKISPSDISADLVDTELRESSCGEPDLLAIMAPSSYKIYGYPLLGGFKRTKGKLQERSAHNGTIIHEPHRYQTKAGGELCLRGYPPWQLRLTEIL